MKKKTIPLDSLTDDDIINGLKSYNKFDNPIRNFGSIIGVSLFQDQESTALRLINIAETNTELKMPLMEYFWGLPFSGLCPEIKCFVKFNLMTDDGELMKSIFRLIKDWRNNEGYFVFKKCRETYADETVQKAYDEIKKTYEYYKMELPIEKYDEKEIRMYINSRFYDNDGEEFVSDVEASMMLDVSRTVDILINAVEYYEESTASLFRQLAKFDYDVIMTKATDLVLKYIDTDSASIISAIIGLLGHWFNDTALELFNKIDIDKFSDKWLRIKYDAIKNSFTDLKR